MNRVCHLTSVHRTDDVRIFHKECVSLANEGYDVYIVGQGESRKDKGVHIVGVGDFNGGRIKRMLSFSKKVYKTALALDADIYHFHDPELLPYGLKLKKKGKKVIFDSHEKYSEQIRTKQYLPSFLTKIIAKCYELYEKRILKRIDAVIFPCTMDGKNPFSGTCRRAEIISNVAVLDEFYGKYSPDCIKLPRAVCYIGGLTADRGIYNDIIAAYNADAKLILAGEFESDAFYNSCKALKEFSCVDYRGKLGREGVTKVLSESCVGLCVLKNKGQYLKIDTFGIKVYEYMSMALPVILSHSPYNDEMIEKYRFGICVDPENPEEIAQAIKYLLDNPEEAAKMGENGRRAIKEEFNWGSEEAKLYKLYEELL